MSSSGEGQLKLKIWETKAKNEVENKEFERSSGGGHAEGLCYRRCWG